MTLHCWKFISPLHKSVSSDLSKIFIQISCKKTNFFLQRCTRWISKHQNKLITSVVIRNVPHMSYLENDDCSHFWRIRHCEEAEDACAVKAETYNLPLLVCRLLKLLPKILRIAVLKWHLSKISKYRWNFLLFSEMSPQISRESSNGCWTNTGDAFLH